MHSWGASLGGQMGRLSSAVSRVSCGPSCGIPSLPVAPGTSLGGSHGNAAPTPHTPHPAPKAALSAGSGKLQEGVGRARPAAQRSKVSGTEAGAPREAGGASGKTKPLACCLRTGLTSRWALSQNTQASQNGEENWLFAASKEDWGLFLRAAKRGGF